MYYMTLPVLYEKVALRSYSETRYLDGRPEGYGSGSPFAMALSGLASGNSAGLVKEFRITGAYLEPRIDEYNAGKIPDSTILLGIALRAAIDKMTHLTSFAWNLDSKPTKSIYQGLAVRPTLTSLDLRYPPNRSPRPIVLVPPIPSLKRLRVSDVDPLCYPDDLSLLLLHAKKLEDLRIHWSPRMRLEAEPSINLRSIFGRCLEAGYKLKVKHLGLQNFYGANTGDLQAICDPDSLRSADFIEVFGGTYGRPTTIWVDDTWKNIPEARYFKNFKQNRISETAPQHAKILTLFSDLEEMYIVGGGSVSLAINGASDPSSPVSVVSTPATSVSTPIPGNIHEKEAASICKQYLRALTTHHGQTLRKLLLSDKWPLSGAQISDLVSHCPNLEQLGIAIDKDASDALTLLSPFFVKLRAVRILKNDFSSVLLEDADLAGLLDGSRREPLYWRCCNATIRWVGIHDKIFRVSKAVQIFDEEGNLEWCNQVSIATFDDVQDFEIWSKDCFEL